MSKAKVLLTRRWPEAVEMAMQSEFEVDLNSSDRPMSESELVQAMGRYDAICPCVTDKMNAVVLGAVTGKAKIIGNYGVGYDHIDLAAARESGLVVTNTPDVLTDGTADLAMTIMLMLSRRGGEGERLVRNNKWKGWYPTHMMGTMVTGKTLGIIGMGRIGQAMAEKAHFGFNMEILYNNRSALSAERLGNLKAEFCADLNDLLKRSDFVALHCPSGPETHNLMNADGFEKMKTSACLINTARGDVIDEEALITALQTKQIAGAGLDVYVGEPRVPEPLKTMENVVLLPHLGSATVETRTAMGMRVLENLKAFFNGNEPKDRIA